MEADLISLEALKRDLIDNYGFFPAIVARALEKQPAIDAVEVVRCKDCIHWYDREEVCLKIYSDGAVHESCWQTRKPDDFCSYGERREENAAD